MYITRTDLLNAYCNVFLASSRIITIIIIIIIIIIIYFNYKWALPSGSGTVVRHNTEITHITRNNTPHSNKTQHTKLHKQ
jgi:hypothetical protein